MDANRAYLDWNASAPLVQAAREAALRALELQGNPSSIHREGRAARAIVEKARGEVADLAGAKTGDVIFTSGGTEANLLALSYLADAHGPAACRIASAVEHASVLHAREDLTVAPVDPSGRIDLAALRTLVAGQGGRVLLSLQLANNETGVLQPLRDAADIVHEAGGLVHADCVQAAGRMVLSLPALGADAITISGHKIGAPKGIGALVLAGGGVRLGRDARSAGGQELGRRPGTENLSGIAGFGAAAEAARHGLSVFATVRSLRDVFETGLKAIAPETAVFGAGADRLANTACYALAGLSAETSLIAYDLDGVAVSSGAACSSGKIKRSHVLEAMGVSPELAECAIRVSIGPATADKHIHQALASFGKQAERLAQRAGRRAA